MSHFKIFYNYISNFVWAASLSGNDVDMSHEKRIFDVPVVTQLLMILQLALVTVGFTCGPDICVGETQTCFNKRIEIYCDYSSGSACRCRYHDIDNNEMIPCNTFPNDPSCWHLPTTNHPDVSCVDSIAFWHCTGDGYVDTSCLDCPSTSTEYTVRCFCNMHSCKFCNISSTMATSSSFPPTRITNTSLTIASRSYGSSSATLFIGSTAISNTGPSLITGSLTITSKPSLILTSPRSTVTQANTVQVIAGLIPTVGILTLGAFSLLVVVVFVILYRKNKNKQNLMSVNQRGSTGTLQQMDNIYYSHMHTLRNNREVLDEGEAPPDYCMITMENLGTNGARANASNSTAADVPYIEADYNTLVHMNTRQIMDNTQQDNNNYSTLSNNTGVATVTNQSAYEHVRDSHDPDYFDDPHVLQQIRAHKE